eukprot:3827009-Rhodomonas_salina.1
MDGSAPGRLQHDAREHHSLRHLETGNACLRTPRDAADASDSMFEGEELACHSMHPDFGRCEHVRSRGEMYFEVEIAGKKG